jgi:hypothetical membrane protein
VTVRVGALLWIAAAVGYFAAEAIAAAVLPGYSYALDYISTLGQPGSSPLAHLMNAAFVAQGVLFPAGAVLVAHRSRSRKALLFLSFAMLNGIGNLLVAAVHSGAGSSWHPVGAALAIVGGNAAVLTGAAALRPAIGLRSHRAASVVLGILGLLCLLLVALGTSPVGLWERGSVYPIFIWQVFTAATLLVLPSDTRARRGAG